MNLELKENSSTVLFNVRNNDEDFETCNFAIVKFSIKLLDRILELKKARELAGAYEISAFYGCVNFLDESEEDLDDIYDLVGNSDDDVFQIQPIDLNDVAMVRTESDLVLVSEHGVKFTALVKNTAVELCTERISWEQIEDMEL